jgi:hypothetical protein
LNLSKQFASFKITVKDGFLIWKFDGAPTMYITNDQILFSPSQCKEFSKTDIEEQYKSILRLLRKATEKKTVCNLCRVNEAKEVAFTHDGKTLQVCEECALSPLVWRILYSGDPRGSR